MAYVQAEARQELMDSVAEATNEISTGLAAVGAAYEQLDDATADTLEEALFRPVQLAYGRSKRTLTSFAERVGMEAPELHEATPKAASRGVKGYIEDMVEAIQIAESILAELQDSLSPVEVGDAELRAGLADVRARLAGLPDAAEHFVSRFGR